jgi:lysophospholipase L1-like esterase
MSSVRIPLQRLATAAVLIGAVAACEQKELVSLPRTSVNQTLFKSYVSLGNSLTAGFQSGGIVDSTQGEAYPVIIAQQAGTRFAIPSLSYPGCPPPVVNFQTQERLGGATSTSTTCALRDPTMITSVLNNVAVPGAEVLDPTASSSANSNALTTFILGGKTQVQRALEANPTFVSIWIGNNDVLGPALSGFATGAPTPVATFDADYDKMISELVSATPAGLGGLLIGVVNVNVSPALFPVDSLVNDPVLDAEFNAAAGTAVPIAADCIGAHALVSIEIIGAIRAHVIPAAIGCATTDPFTLDTIKQAIVTASAIAYNAHIKSVATTNGFAYVDVSPILAALKARGLVATVPNFLSATSPFGPIISLDGIHPTALGQQLLANTFILAINKQYAVAIDTVAHQ